MCILWLFPLLCLGFSHFLPFAVREHLPNKPRIPNPFLRVFFQKTPDQNTACELVSLSNHFPCWQKHGEKEGVTVNWGRASVHDFKYKYHLLLKFSQEQILTKVERLDGQEFLERRGNLCLIHLWKWPAQPNLGTVICYHFWGQCWGKRPETCDWMNNTPPLWGVPNLGHNLALRFPLTVLDFFFFYS